MNPIEAVQAFPNTEGNDMPFAVSMGPLIYQQYVMACGSGDGETATEIPNVYAMTFRQTVLPPVKAQLLTKQTKQKVLRNNSYINNVYK